MIERDRNAYGVYKTTNRGDEFYAFKIKRHVNENTRLKCLSITKKKTNINIYDRRNKMNCKGNCLKLIFCHVDKFTLSFLC